jgi:hypothetical protein
MNDSEMDAVTAGQAAEDDQGEQEGENQNVDE